jgi:hypothetical protein
MAAQSPCSAVACQQAAELNRHQDFWRLAGGKRFVEAVRTGPRERRSILIHEPFDPQPLAAAIGDLTRDQGLDALYEIDGSQPVDSLCDHLQSKLDPIASTVDGFAFSLNYAVILAWNVAVTSTLLEELSSFAKSCAVRGEMSAPIVIIVSSVPIDQCTQPVWEKLEARGILGPHDGIGFAAGAGRGIHTFEHRLKTNVAVEVGAWDLDIIERILSMPTHRATRPDAHLNAWSDRRADAWRDDRPNWTAGSLDEWGGEACVHPLYLAANKPTLLTKRVWRGQVAVLFPWLEEFRQAVIRTYRRHLRPDDLSYGGDVDSLDWGPVCWQLGRAGIDRWALDAIHAGRKIRNDLAHGRPVDWSAIQSFGADINKVSLLR